MPRKSFITRVTISIGEDVSKVSPDINIRRISSKVLIQVASEMARASSSGGNDTMLELPTAISPLSGLSQI
jgi:hypothetical protein